jgi:hypothetical protein
MSTSTSTSTSMSTLPRPFVADFDAAPGRRASRAASLTRPPGVQDDPSVPARLVALCLGASTVLAALLVRSPTAFAQEPVRARLDLTGAPGCAAASELEAAVEAQLGRDAIAEPADVVVTIAASSEAPDPEIALTLRSADGASLGVRTLRVRGGNCRGVTAELSLVLSLLIDLREDEVVLVVRPPPPAPGLTLDPALSLSLVGWLDLLPGAVPGARLGTELGVGPVSLELGLQGSLPTVVARDGGGAQLFAWALRVGACGVASLESLRLGGCLALEAGGLAVEGRGLDVNLSAVRGWSGLGAVARLGLRFDVLELRVQPGVLVPFVRDAFFYEQAGERVGLHQAAPVAPTLELVAAVHLGT